MIISYKQIPRLLRSLVNEIEIPDNYYEKANTSYQSFSNWVNRTTSTISIYDIEIFLQGSFKIGTVIKPIFETDSYDIDMVCKINDLTKRSMSQSDYKKMIGVEVESYAKAQNMLNEPHNGTRCWTLNYNDEANFHIDILPCLDDKEYFSRYHEGEFQNVSFVDKVIAMTDKRSSLYNIISDDWTVSNPKGYFNWFFMKSNQENAKIEFASKYSVDIEKLPDYKVKTNLQRVIQIFKRHRDIMFQHNPDNKPSSIIITTLAAHTYKSTYNFLEAFLSAINNMDQFIYGSEGSFSVLNPVNPKENFAEKWNDDSRKKREFDNWIKKLKKNYGGINPMITNYSDALLESISADFDIHIDKVKKFSGIEQFSLTKSTAPHRLEPKWNNTTTVNVIIEGKKYKYGLHEKEFKSGEVLEKSVQLKFIARAANIREYDIEWQITNTGLEAKSAGCMRGDFYKSENENRLKLRKETTSYEGTHYVECYLIKDGYCYGKSEPFLVNISSEYQIW